MESYYPDAQSQWPFAAQNGGPQQQTSAQPDWNALALAAADVQDPLAALQNESNTLFPNFASLGGHQQQASQPFFEHVFNSPIAWTYSGLNGTVSNGQPQSPTVRISQQPQQTMHHPGTTVDPATLVMQNSHFAQSLQAFPVQPPPPPSFVNPSQLHQPQQQFQQALSPPAETTTNGSKASPTLSDLLKPLLSSKILENGGRSAVNAIVDTIESYGGPADVEPRVRLEIMSRIRDNAGDDFREAWANHSAAMEIVRSWLKAGISGKGAGSDESNDGLIALLHVINRLPLTVGQLLETKLGRYIKHLMKEPPSNAIRSVANELEKSWREQVRRAEAEGMPDHEKTEADSRGRKRKLSEAGAARDAPPAKKAAIASSSTAKVIVKKETKAGSTSTTVVGARSDSSFFSAPKAKPKLPTFKKTPAASAPAVKPEPNVAQPMSIDPFQEAMKSLNRGRFGSPAQSGAPPSTTVAAASSSVPDANKKKKRVVFAPEHELRKIKYIERAVYDDDPTDGAGTGHNVRDLDRAEGAAMHKHLFEELIDWYEPYVVDVSQYAIPLDRGSNSQEKNTQELRELTTLAALYQTPDAVPPSPAEPAWVPDEGPEPQIMMAGVELDGIFNTTPAPSVPELLSDLAATVPVPVPVPVVPAPPPPVPEPQPVLPVQVPVPDANYNVPPDLLKRLTAQLAAQSAATAPAPAPVVAPALPPPLVYGQPSAAPPAYPGVNPWEQAQQPVQPQPDHVWNAQPTFGQQQQPPQQHQNGGQQWGMQQGWRGGRGGGGGGRGRGRGGGNWNNGKKRCNFFAAGRCRYGDQCDYAHERD